MVGCLAIQLQRLQQLLAVTGSLVRYVYPVRVLVISELPNDLVEVKVVHDVRKQLCVLIVQVNVDSLANVVLARLGTTDEFVKLGGAVSAADSDGDISCLRAMAQALSRTIGLGWLQPVGLWGC